jgi:hypothetical protein
MVKELLGDHETIIVHLRKDVDTSTDVNKDAGTADFNWLDESTRNNGMDTKKIFRIIIKIMENSTNEVCTSRSYCRVGKITQKEILKYQD